MRKSFRSLTVDRERAVRAGAMLGLVVLGISTLPGLLRTPEPPPVPDGVGFSPTEMARYENRRVSPGRDARNPAKERKRQLEEKLRKRAAGRHARKPARDRKRAAGRHRKPGKGRSGSAAAGPASGAPANASPAASDPTAVPVAGSSSPPDPVAPAPAYPPAPATNSGASSPPAIPADGSQEFAPR